MAQVARVEGLEAAGGLATRRRSPSRSGRVSSVFSISISFHNFSCRLIEWIDFVANQLDNIN
jgi:hypothetical protein